jgi:hypothetical protein
MKIYTSILSSLDIKEDGSVAKSKEVRAMNKNDITMSRQELYDEVWDLSVAGVAKKYGVDYVNLLRICKESDIPIPTPKYWAKKNGGSQCEKEILPESSIDTINLSAKKQKQKELPVVSEPIKEQTETKIELVDPLIHKYRDRLLFLEENERLVVLRAADTMTINDEKKRFHKKIIEYKKTVEEWNKKDRKSLLAKRTPENYLGLSLPFLAGVVSSDALPRTFRIIDTLAESIEKLGGKLTDNLGFIIRGENVSLSIQEYQDRTDHVLSKDEKYNLLEYEDNKKRGKYAYLPRMPKYDHIFNGRIKISIEKGKYYRDTKTDSIENQLGLILIDLYEKSESTRLKRIAAEERDRIRKEEQEKKRIFNERKNQEIELTIQLKNCAMDYEMACRIRAFIDAVKSNINDSKKKEDWIEWANKKADWYDPSIAYEDEFLGVRDHGKDEEYKKLKNSYGYW